MRIGSLATISASLNSSSELATAAGDPWPCPTCPFRGHGSTPKTTGEATFLLCGWREGWRSEPEFARRTANPEQMGSHPTAVALPQGAPACVRPRIAHSPAGSTQDFDPICPPHLFAQIVDVVGGLCRFCSKHASFPGEVGCPRSCATIPTPSRTSASPSMARTTSTNRPC